MITLQKEYIMNEIVILGILIRRDIVDIVRFQNLLTSYGCIIRTRLGLHENHYETNALLGLLLLELDGDREQMTSFEKAAKEIEGIEVQKMQFHF